jgi:hypothetical protein
MTWLLVCDACAEGEEIKTIGVMRKPPYACDVCGVALPLFENGYVNGNPAFPQQVEEIKSRMVSQ